MKRTTPASKDARRGSAPTSAILAQADRDRGDAPTRLVVQGIDLARLLPSLRGRPRRVTGGYSVVGKAPGQTTRRVEPSPNAATAAA
jgi:hypothetical protein